MKTNETKVEVIGPIATMALNHGGHLEQIHDAVVELIEADREYDEAHAVYAMAEDESGWPRVEAAIQRRVAALARIGGAK